VQIVIYRSSNKRVLEIFPDVVEILDRGDDFIKWDDGSINGSNHLILVLPGEIEIALDDTLTEDIIEQDIPFVPQSAETNREIDVLRRALRVSVAKLIRADELSEEELGAMIDIYPEFSAGEPVKVGDLLKYGGNLYEVIQEHTTQSEWTPPETPALFLRVQPEGVIPEWVQPTGSHDAYDEGAKVTFNGDIYISTVDDNVWSPDEYGWELYTEGGD